VAGALDQGREEADRGERVARRGGTPPRAVHRLAESDRETFGREPSVQSLDAVRKHGRKQFLVVATFEPADGLVTEEEGVRVVRPVGPCPGGPYSGRRIEEDDEVRKS
jgi:hypothetical protein